MCAIPPAALFTVTRSWFIVGRVQPELERALGGSVSIGSARYLGEGRIALENAVLSAPGVPGPAGRIAHAGRIILKLDLGALVVGKMQIDDLEVDQALLRLSEDRTNQGDYSFMHLMPVSNRKSGPSPSGFSRPTRIRVRNLAIEAGTHIGNSYTILGRRIVAGEMYPVQGQDAYRYELGEIDQGGRAIGPGGIFVKGEYLGAGEFHIRTDGLELDQRAYWLCPASMRSWWDRTNLSGTVDAFRVDYVPGSPLQMSFRFREGEMTLPIESEEFWVRLHSGRIKPADGRPRLILSEGFVVSNGNALRFENLKGYLASSGTDPQLIPMPCEFDLALEDLPPIGATDAGQWLTSVLSDAPFAARLRILEMHLTSGLGHLEPAVEMPQLLARVLERFEFQRATLSLSLDVQRSKRRDGDPGEVSIKGMMHARDGIGRLKGFPYPIRSINAYVQFDQEHVLLHHVKGSGPGDSQLQFSAAGAFGSNYWAQMNVTAKSLPIDARLICSLNMLHPAVSSAIIEGHSNAQVELRRDSHVRNEAANELAKIDALTLRCATPKGSIDSRNGRQLELMELVTHERDQLARILNSGLFRAEACADLDLRIGAPETDGRDQTVSGIIVVHENGLSKATRTALGRLEPALKELMN